METAQSAQRPVPEFLAGGGEMGALIRNRDWSKTPLGPVEEWPQSLKTCVRIILTSSQPMFVWWGHELINLYNDPYRAIVGGKHPQALGQPAQVVWREIWDQIGPRAETAMQKNIGTYDEALLLIMERNGYPEETYYTFSYSPVPGDQGGAGGIICANSDDTQRIIGERQLRTLKDLGRNALECKTEAEVYEKTIRVLSENPRDFPFACIYEITHNGARAQLRGQTPGELPAALLPANLDLQSEIAGIWQLPQAMASGGAPVVAPLHAFRQQLPSGGWQRPPGYGLVLPVMQGVQTTPFALLIVGLSPYRQLDEKYKGFFRLVADQLATVMANTRAYEEERKRAEALLEIDRAKTTFFSNISHEFRTPLTLMLGPLEELLRDKRQRLEPAQQRSLEAVHRNALRLLRMVNSLLDFSRIEAGRASARYARANLAQLTMDIAGTFRSAIESAGLAFHVQCSPLATPAYIDHEMWEKIVLNLLSNAFKYTLQGSISLRLAEEGNYAVLQVQDTGAGVPESELPHMFRRFHRVSNTRGRSYEGTGIGLSLVKELVQQHRGSISVSSSEGAGSTFTVRIPLGKDHLPAQQVQEHSLAFSSTLSALYMAEATGLGGNGHTTAAMPAAGNASAQKPLVLVVDDNTDMRAYLQHLLEKHYTVATAVHGKHALELIALEQPELVISDVMMPEMDGVQLLHAIKQDPRYANLPVILLSARAGEEARIAGYDIGADDYLVKPFSANELLARVRAQIRISRAYRHTGEQLRSLFRQAPVAIGVMRGPSLIVEIANDKLLEYWDRSPLDVLHKPLFEALPETAGKGLEEQLQRVLATGERFAAEELCIELKRHGRLEPTYLSFVYEPLRDPDGKITHLIVVAHEVTALVNAREQARYNAVALEQQVQERTLELLHKNAELEQFAYVASHDLQEPLRKIRTFAELLQQELPAQAAGSRYFEKIQSAASRMTDLIRDLLTYSRLSKKDEQFVPVDLNVVMQQVMSDLELLIEQKQASVRYPVLPVVPGIPLQLQQLFSNLLSNSLKFTEQPPQITITVEMPGAVPRTMNDIPGNGKAYVKLCFKDNGIGFEPQYAEQIFTIFQRLNERKQYNGTGIGLAMCRKIVENHHGFISARSAPGEGAEFEVLLPL